MYDILTLEPEDKVVIRAVNALIAGRTTLTHPAGNYRLLTPGGTHVEGDGGSGVEILVIVGHGSADALSGCASWPKYREHFEDEVDWDHKSVVYLAACSLSGDGGRAFEHGHFAAGVRKGFPRRVTVWASSTAVRGGDLTGDWEKL